MNNQEKIGMISIIIHKGGYIDTFGYLVAYIVLDFPMSFYYKY